MSLSIGPAGGVQHQAGLVAPGIDLPEFLHTNAVGLRVLAGIEIEAADHLLGQRAARAFGKDGVFAKKLHAKLEFAGRLAVLADAQVASGHAAQAAVFVVERLCSGKSGEDLDTLGFGLFAEPARQVRQAHDVVAVVAKTVG